ncbi:antA/AntB antirepressor family protein [Bacillus gobiensis]|uniref:antA/AntB antirepressor family protein n=1 Tax=Bacillus gobiensis TaxID=1441095 RepID=UPI003D1A6EE0
MNLKTIANDMLPVYENEQSEKLASAREIHEKLLSKRHFTEWVNTRIQNYGFLEGEDFFTWTRKSTGGRPSKDIYFTLDVAKEVAMVENNEMGRAIRKYFIEVEKRSRQKYQPQSIEDLIILQAQSVKEIKEKQKRLEEQNTTLKHRIDNLDQIDINGDAQQRFNKMIKRFAWDNGLPMGTAWKQFDKAFNTSYQTNITTKRQNYAEKHGFKNLTRPQYLSLVEQLEDAIRVADKLLNNSKEVG